MFLCAIIHTWWLHSCVLLLYNYAPVVPANVVIVIYTAALAGSPAVAGVLIQHGADVNRRDVDGNTPLMVSGRLCKY